MSQSFSSSMKYYAKYGVLKSGLFDKIFYYTNEVDKSVYQIAIKSNSTKYLKIEGDEIFELKSGSFAFFSSKWYISYLKDNSEMYRSVELKTKFFQFTKSFSIKMIDHNGCIDYYKIKHDPFSLFNFKLVRKEDPKNPIMKYKYKVFGEDYLEVFEDLPLKKLEIFILLITYVFITETRKFSYQMAGLAMAS